MSTAINRISDLLFHEKKYTRSHTSLSQKHHTNSPQNTRKIESHTEYPRGFSFFTFDFFSRRTRNRFVFVVVCCVIADTDCWVMESERERKRDAHKFTRKSQTLGELSKNNRTSRSSLVSRRTAIFFLFCCCCVCFDEYCYSSSHTLLLLLLLFSGIFFRSSRNFFSCYFVFFLLFCRHHQSGKIFCCC